MLFVGTGMSDASAESPYMESLSAPATYVRSRRARRTNYSEKASITFLPRYTQLGIPRRVCSQKQRVLHKLQVFASVCLCQHSFSSAV